MGDQGRSPPPAIPRRPSTTAVRATSSGCARPKQLDLVYNATPWEFHVPIMLAAMKNGKHTATEVPGGDDARRLLGDGRGGGEAPEALRDDGELQLRPHGDDGLQHGPAGAVRRDPPRRGRAICTICASSSSRDDGEGLWRRAWATKLNGNLYPDSRARSGRQLPRHQPRRSLRLSRLDERAVARAAGLGRGARARRLAEAQGALRPRRRQRQPDQDRARPHDRRRSTAPTCRDPTAASTWCRAPRGCSRDIRTASTSKGAAKRINGRTASGRPRPSSSIRCGRRSPRRRRARATAGWTSSRTTA